MTKSHLHRRRAARQTGYDEGLAAGEAERNNLKGKYQSIVTLLDAARRRIQEIFDHLDDEGDRVYLGSTNHRDWLRDMLDHMDRWSLDAMLPKGDINKMEADPYAEVRTQRARAEAAEAELDSRTRELDEAETELRRLRTGIKRLSDEEEMCAETSGDDPFSMTYLAAKLAAAEKLNSEQEKLREKAEAELERLQRWRPISEADNSIAYVHIVGDMRIANSYPIWARDADGRVYEALWSDNERKAYWWDIDGESSVDPVEFMPHPLATNVEAV
ncbi:hypothetical protein [Agrobacterium pusense]|uniref:hypothetical protein n=1 Tax=Agrobacterium pusense TaxID=648995 RepID=UPI0028B266B4|nr:hypothetical protein [Agrobacterium pusense]